MTTLGIVEDVSRTLYRDDVNHINVYPLDEKIELLRIEDRYSRYTGNFAHLASEYYARMPERDALNMLEKTLNIDLKLDSLTRIGEAVAKPYLPKLYDEADELLPASMNGPGFLEQRIQEIDASPDRDAIILKALEENIEGVERKRAESDLTVTYVESDGTGVSGLPRELSGKGKSGGPAKTFEAKIGVLFNQGFDPNGLPLLDNKRIYRLPNSTQYMGTTEKIGQFTPQLACFTIRNGIDCADQIVFLSDGATWLEKLREKLYPYSIGIVDLYHARQHLLRIVNMLGLNINHKRIAFHEECSHLLDLGDIDRLVTLISTKINKSNRADVEKELAYFTNNKHKMRYGLFRAAGLFVGSGVVEAACKIIVENRLNGSGMRWSKKHAANVIALRCAIYSGRFGAAVAA